MIGIFAFDGPMYRDVNGQICDNKITDEILKRYLDYVDHLYLIIRVQNIRKTYIDSHLSPLFSDKVEILEVPNFVSPKGFIMKDKQIPRLEKIVEKADLIFLRIPSITCNLIASICKKKNKPYLVEVGGCAWDSYFNHSIRGKIVAPIVYYSQKKTVKNASFATYVTEKWLQKRYPSKGPSINASNVYLSNFDDSKIRSRIIKYKKGNPSVFKIGTLANVDVKYKGQDDLIKAISILKKEGIKVTYELVGGGDRTYLSALAKKYNVENQVVFLGTKLHEEIWDWLDQIDIYAQPSKQEGLPRALIEAMNRGCICVGSTIAGIPELLQQDELFKPGNIKEIVTVLKRIIYEENHEERIRRNFIKSKDYSLDILNQNRKFIFDQYFNLILKE